MSLQYHYIPQAPPSRASSDFSDTLSHSRVSELNVAGAQQFVNGLGKVNEVQQNGDDDRLSDESPSGDSGFSDNHLVEKFQLDKQSMVLVKELKTVARLTEDFYRDVVQEREACRDLLAELERKIRPFLIKLDEQIGQQEEVVKRNLDKCRITDARVSWLLHYNHFMLDFRRIVEQLTTGIYDEMERVLRLKTRGCHGVEFKANMHEKMNVVIHQLDQLETSIRIEVSKSETSYEHDMANGRSFR